jgi:hypothetical protein
MLNVNIILLTFINRDLQMKKISFLFCILALSIPSFSQCVISNRLSPTGALNYYIKPEVFYFTKAKSLRGGVITDKENYFLTLQPIPFPKKPEGRKLTEDLELKLSNMKVYTLQHFDTQYMDHDTVMQLLYLIDKGDIEDLLNFEATEAKIDMKGKEGIRTYIFKLHKNAIQMQLACFLKKEEAKKKDK